MASERADRTSHQPHRGAQLYGEAGEALDTVSHLLQIELAALLSTAPRSFHSSL